MIDMEWPVSEDGAAGAWLSALRAGGMPEPVVRMFKGLIFFHASYLTGIDMGAAEDSVFGPGPETCCEGFWALVTLVQTGDTGPFLRLFARVEIFMQGGEEVFA